MIKLKEHQIIDDALLQDYFDKLGGKNAKHKSTRTSNYR